MTINFGKLCEFYCQRSSCHFRGSYFCFRINSAMHSDTWYCAFGFLSTVSGCATESLHIMTQGGLDQVFAIGFDIVDMDSFDVEVAKNAWSQSRA